MFDHRYEGRVLKADILFDMDAQIEFLVEELRRFYDRVEQVVTDPAVTVDEATDEVLYNFETPGSVTSKTGKLPRSDPAVQTVFAQRRTHARLAHDVYRDAHPA